MCLLVIIIVALIAFAIYAASVGLLAILTVIIGIIFIRNIVNYSKSKNYIASPKVCPACKSTNIGFNMVASGARSSTWNYSEKWSETNTEISNQKVAICNDCGHSFNFYSDADIQSVKSKNKTALTLSAVLLVAIACALIYALSL